MASELTSDDHLRAWQRAKAAGDEEAAAVIHQQLVQSYQTANPTDGMSAGQRVAANLGAGMENAGLGLAQLLLPKSLEHKLGITDESINERRGRDEKLADSTTGGKLLQVGGEMLPGMLVPGGAAARGLGMLPKVGAALRGLGVGARVLPTAVADSAVLGGVQGAATPTTSEDSPVLDALGGAAGGAIAPGMLAGLGAGAKALLKPVSRRVQQSALAQKLGAEMDTSPAAQQKLEQQIQASQARGVDSPQSLATVTQDPAVARMELAARANPDTSPSWQTFDEAGHDARWGALDKALGNEASVAAAKKETDQFATKRIPEVFSGINGDTLEAEIANLGTTAEKGVSRAGGEADPAKAEVFGYVRDALGKVSGGGAKVDSLMNPVSSEPATKAKALWNIRKTLSDWLEGAPPPGKEGTRGAAMDRPIMEMRKAIDAALNKATGDKWSNFLGEFGGFLQKEGAQKAGQNIRNTFFDETLGAPRGATTTAGNPAATRAKLEQALIKHGKNDFGETLDPTQRGAVDSVLHDLRGEEILQRAKSSMTGKGGSQTAPLEALMKRSGSRVAGNWLTDIAQVVTHAGSKGQQKLLNEVLQSPQDALAIMRQAQAMKDPLTDSEKRLVQAARGVLASPSALVLLNQQADEPSE